MPSFIIIIYKEITLISKHARLLIVDKTNNNCLYNTRNRSALAWLLRTENDQIKSLLNEPSHGTCNFYNN